MSADFFERHQMGTFTVPVMSEWFEKTYGRHAFANLWEAYAGGDVIDLTRHRAHAEHEFGCALDMMSIAGVRPTEALVDRGRLRIRFVSGGVLEFICEGRRLEEQLRGRRPTRVDGAVYFSRDLRDYLGARGTEVV